MGLRHNNSAFSIRIVVFAYRRVLVYVSRQHSRRGCEYVDDKPSLRSKVIPSALKARLNFFIFEKMREGIRGDEDQVEFSPKRVTPHVSFMKRNLKVVAGRSSARCLQHRRRSVDSGYIRACQGKRNRESSGTASQLKNGPATGRNPSLIERQIVWAREERVVVPRVIVQIPHSHQA
jgi:hypothetical protein